MNRDMLPLPLGREGGGLDGGGDPMRNEIEFKLWIFERNE